MCIDRKLKRHVCAYRREGAGGGEGETGAQERERDNRLYLPRPKRKSRWFERDCDTLQLSLTRSPHRAASRRMFADVWVWGGGRGREKKRERKMQMQYKNW